MSEMKIIEKNRPLPKTYKVAAYARVSSDKDAMLHSLSSQVSYFSKLIQANDNWTYVGVYSDEGKTGTKCERDAFQEIVNDAKNGKIDIIVTKSVSRFARNTVTLLETIRELKAIGVDVYFDEQKIHTLSSEGELLLSILASYAQEESRACSENTLWRVKKNFTEGKTYGGDSCYGYQLKKGKFILEPKQAETVKRIFELYLQNNGDMKIARILNDEGVPTYEGGLWTKTSVRGILLNYNYTGNLLLQKTFVENHLTKIHKTNKGEKPQYLVEEDHEPIVSLETYERCLGIRKQRSSKTKVTSNEKKYAFSGFIRCGNCGKVYKHKNNQYREYWICDTYEGQGKAYCDSKQVRDDVLKKSACEVLGLVEFDEKVVKEKIKLIEVFNGHKLIFHFYDGTQKEHIWKERSRSESWTPEMRAKVGEKNKELASQKKRGENGKWEK